jgi:tetratricopeptide (TPR) repeat protein
MQKNGPTNYRILTQKAANWMRTVGCMLLVSMVATQARGGDFEVQFSADDFKKLDTYEGHVLSKADGSFAKGDYKRALAEYDAFLLEFPDSPKSVPYALMRKARCLHKEQKRYEAVKVYQEVLDLFPNSVAYAAPAIYYQGMAHWENGEVDKAVEKWVKMASDPEYNRHYLGATAFTQLADQLVKQGKPDQAVQYYELVAKNFRTENPTSANYAIDQLVKHFIRTSPNEAKLALLYKELKTFGGHPGKVDDDLAKSRAYWDMIRGSVRRYGTFGEGEQALKKNYLQYWTGQLEKRFPDWDDYQIMLASFYLELEGDEAKWLQRMDKLFTANQKPDDYDRVIRWIRMYSNHKKKAEEYYDKVALDKLTNKQLVELMMIAYDQIKNPTMGKSVYSKIKMADMADADKISLGSYFWKLDPSLLPDIYGSMQDKEMADMEWLKYYVSKPDEAKAMPLFDKMIRTERFTEPALLMRAEFLFSLGKYQQAITAFRACNNPPQNLWRIVDCFMKLQQYDAAIEQLREVEAFFKNQAPQAAIRMAYVYRTAGKGDLFQAGLRRVLKQYPKSDESRTAHLELERMNVRIGGGVDAEE